MALGLAALLTPGPDAGAATPAAQDAAQDAAAQRPSKAAQRRPQTAQDAALRSFLHASATTSRQGLDATARRFGVAQLPLLAASLAARPADDPLVRDPATYRALVRWHLWLSSHLDPQNDGLWREDPAALHLGSGPIVTNAVLPTLEWVYLEALAILAHRQGLLFDAQVWWRDAGLLRRRLVLRLYDPLSGGYAAYDSVGRRLPESFDFDDLLPLALGAPHLQEPSARFAHRAILGSDSPTRADSLDADAARMRALQTLDPLNGWPRRPGLRLLSPQQTATLLVVALGRLGLPELQDLATRVLRSAGLAAGDRLPLQLGSRRFEVTLPDETAAAAVRAHSTVAFLSALGLLRPAERQRFEDLWDNGTAGSARRARSDSLEALMQAWSALDLRQRRAELGRDRAFVPQAPEKGAAFQYREEDGPLWARRALARLQEEVARLQLAPVAASRYRAWIDPPVLHRSAAPLLRLRVPTASLADSIAHALWRAAWVAPTGGGLGASRLQLRRTGPLELAARLSLPPREEGLLRLVVRGPLGPPRRAPSATVTDPFEASVRALAPVPGQALRRYEVLLTSRAADTVRGRMELRCPPEWVVSPGRDQPFVLAAGTQRRLVIEIDLEQGLPPGLYPMEWGFFDTRGEIARLPTDLAVHFHWLRIGPFTAGVARPLGPRHPPDRLVDPAARYQGPEGEVRWRHVEGTALGSDGWVTLVPADAPRGVYYALTAFSTTSRECSVRLEASEPTLLRLSGETILDLEGPRRRSSSECMLTVGSNYLLLKMLGGGGRAARFRVEFHDIDGGPLHQVQTELAQLVDGYAYLGEDEEPADLHLQRERFRLVALNYDAPHAMSVSIVGSFNGWSPTATPMHRTEDGRWRAEFRLEPGRFEYKFAIDGDRWVPDPANPNRVEDGFGGENSVLILR